MKFLKTWTLMMALGLAGIAEAQYQIMPDKGPQQLFSGIVLEVAVSWCNVGGKTLDSEVHTRILQTSSATAVQWAEKPWKRLQISPGQTVVESAQMSFPAVDAETKFLIQWLDESNHVLGKTDVLVYPTNLLNELKSVLGEDQLGVLDPNGQLKTLFKQNHVQFSDLGEMALEDFHGKLAILGPFKSKAQIREGFSSTVQKIASKGVAVVWIQPPLALKDEMQPSFYVVPGFAAAVVVAKPELIANFAENPQSQLNLVTLCKLALKPKPLVLPNFDVQ